VHFAVGTDHLNRADAEGAEKSNAGILARRRGWLDHLFAFSEHIFISYSAMMSIRVWIALPASTRIRQETTGEE
jgi:hypothetical protein